MKFYFYLLLCLLTVCTQVCDARREHPSSKMSLAQDVAAICPATPCPSGICQDGVCVQECHDARCGHCTTQLLGGCDTCKSGTLVDGCCVDDCVKVSGSRRFRGIYKQVKMQNGFPFYINEENDKTLFMDVDCPRFADGCGWVFGEKGFASTYAVSKTSGGAIESSGHWVDDVNIQVSQCHIACLDNPACDTPPKCHKGTGKCGACGCTYDVDVGAACDGDNICDAQGICMPKSSGRRSVAIAWHYVSMFTIAILKLWE